MIRAYPGQLQDQHEKGSLTSGSHSPSRSQRRNGPGTGREEHRKSARYGSAPSAQPPLSARTAMRSGCETGGLGQATPCGLFVAL